MADSREQKADAPGVAKILHVLWSLERAGLELLVLNLVRFSDRAKYQHIICCLGVDGPLRQPFENERCRVHLMAPGGAGRAGMLARSARLIRQVLPDVIHLHRNGPDIWGQVAALLGGAGRVVATEHSAYRGRDPEKEVGRFKTLPRRLLRSQVRVHIAISQSVADELVARHLAPPQRIVVIHNGVDEQVLTPSARKLFSGKDIVVGSVGRLVPLKGHEFVVRAAAQLKARHPRLRIRIAGAGPDLLRLEDLASGLDVADRISFEGEVADVRAFLGDIDVFVLASTQEGFGVSLVEAMSCGLPVIAAAVGGVPEIVTPSVDGLLFRAADAADLASAIERYLDDPPLAARVGLAARTTVLKRFTIREMVRRYEEIYEDVLRGQTSEAEQPHAHPLL
ncbi:MAG: glycosyltransferase [Verrucomicrobiota bacterium]